MVGSGAPGGGGSLKYFTPNIDIPALFDPKEFDCNKKTYLIFKSKRVQMDSKCPKWFVVKPI